MQIGGFFCLYLYNKILEMKKEQIENMIDKKIEKSLSENSIISKTIEELCVMSSNIIKALSNIEYKVEDYDGIEFDMIKPARARYVVHYVRHCEKRKSDLMWLIKKKELLDKTSEEMFRLVKFKDKMGC